MPWPTCIRYNIFTDIETAVVRCAQTGKKHLIKIRNLSRDDDTEQLTLEDLQEGSSLIMMHRKTPYPVTFVQLKGEYVIVTDVLYILLLSA